MRDPLGRESGHRLRRLMVDKCGIDGLAKQPPLDKETRRAMMACADLAQDMFAVSAAPEPDEDHLTQALVKALKQLPGEEDGGPHILSVRVQIETMLGCKALRSSPDHIKELAFAALVVVRNNCMPDSHDWSSSTHLTADEIAAAKCYFPCLNELLAEIVHGPMPEEWRERFKSLLDDLN